MSDTPGWIPPDLRRGLLPPSSRSKQRRRVGDALRGLISNLVATEAPEEALAALGDDLEDVAERWSVHPKRHWYQGVSEASLGGDVHAFVDDSPMMGRANPLAPPVDAHAEEVDGRATIVATATFGPQYEGPPGHVHGGFVAAAFDEVLGMAQSLAGNPGMTGYLHVDYRSPTPLATELRFTGWVDRVEGRKIFCLGTLHAGERLCAESHALFISVDFAKIAALRSEG